MSTAGTSIKSRIAAGETVTGMTLNFVDAGLAEYAGRLGFDYVMVDGEHGRVEDATVENVVRAADLTGIGTIMRLAFNGPMVERYLGIGVTGVHIPRVRSAAEARAVVDAVKFSPAGARGLGSFRAADFGLRPGWPVDFMRVANEDTLILLAVEDRQGIEALPDIVRIDAVDAILIGEQDLSDSLGYPGQKDHPAVRELADHAIGLALGAGKAVGLAGGGTPAGVESARARGARMISTSLAGLFGASARPFLRAVHDR